MIGSTSAVVGFLAILIPSGYQLVQEDLDVKILEVVELPKEKPEASLAKAPRLPAGWARPQPLYDKEIIGEVLTVRQTQSGLRPGSRIAILHDSSLDWYQRWCCPTPPLVKGGSWRVLLVSVPGGKKRLYSLHGHSGFYQMPSKSEGSPHGARSR